MSDNEKAVHDLLDKLATGDCEGEYHVESRVESAGEIVYSGHHLNAMSAVRAAAEKNRLIGIGDRLVEVWIDHKAPPYSIERNTKELITWPFRDKEDGKFRRQSATQGLVSCGMVDGSTYMELQDAIKGDAVAKPVGITATPFAGGVDALDVAPWVKGAVRGEVHGCYIAWNRDTGEDVCRAVADNGAEAFKLMVEDGGICLESDDLDRFEMLVTYSAYCDSLVEDLHKEGRLERNKDLMAINCGPVSAFTDAGWVDERVGRILAEREGAGSAVAEPGVHLVLGDMVTWKRGLKPAGFRGVEDSVYEVIRLGGPGRLVSVRASCGLTDGLWHHEGCFEKVSDHDTLPALEAGDLVIWKGGTHSREAVRVQDVKDADGTPMILLDNFPFGDGVWHEESKFEKAPALLFKKGDRVMRKDGCKDALEVVSVKRAGDGKGTLVRVAPAFNHLLVGKEWDDGELFEAFDACAVMEQRREIADRCNKNIAAVKDMDDDLPVGWTKERDSWRNSIYHAARFGGFRPRQLNGTINSKGFGRGVLYGTICVPGVIWGGDRPGSDNYKPVDEMLCWLHKRFNEAVGECDFGVADTVLTVINYRVRQLYDAYRFGARFPGV